MPHPSLQARPRPPSTHLDVSANGTVVFTLEHDLYVAQGSHGADEVCILALVLEITMVA